MGDVQKLQQLFERFIEKYDEDHERLKEQHEQLKARLESLELFGIRTDLAEPDVTNSRLPSHSERTVEEGHVSRTSVPRFVKMDFPSYDGNDDPLVWLTRCDHLFKYQNTPEEEKVGLATFHLLGDAQLWFLRLSDSRPNLYWNDFKSLCNVRFGLTLGSIKLEELAKLQQTDLVLEYDRRFE